ncbi:uncharacterized protein LOC128677535 [Plodia interpunctella]|uniref:uncharacterized protein LOC128677535 n=1 Tax=Plodia interpunctella TaxID=58824 RepID=UPI002367661E|nr:uncharacterized protein LOC128677535 [Plodia interpunctella]
MKLFLALAFVAMAAAAPEPVRLPEPAKPMVAEPSDVQADPVRFVDEVQQDAPVVDAVKIADAPKAQEVQVDAVKFVDLAEDTPTVDAIKIAEAPAEIKVKVDAVKFVDSPQPEVVEPILADPVKIYTPFELARGAQPIQSDDSIFVHAPLVQFLNIQEEAKADAVNFVESPVEQKVVKIAELPAPIVLQAAPLPVVRDAQFDGVKFVDQVGASPLEMQPILPIDPNTKVVPQQVMDIIMIAENILADHQRQVDMGNIVVDPMLR